MKNICFIIYDFSIFGGVEKVLSMLANSMSDKYNVHVLSICSENNSPAYKLDDKIKYKYLTKSGFRIRELAKKCFSDIKKYLKLNAIDVAFLMGNYPVPICLPVKPFVRSKFVYCDHGSIMNEIHKKDITFFRKIAARFCDKVVTLTERNLNDYKKEFKISDKKLSCIYNPMDEDIFKHTINQYNLKSDKIITAGRFTKEKGFDMLIDVAQMVFNKHPNWQWHVYGDGEEFEDIQGRIRDKGLADKLILKGATNNIYELYKDYALYVLPSYREGLPLVLLEAKANRLPIVAFDVVTGPREIVNDNENGFLIPCYDKKIMADKICELIENQDLRKEFSEKSQLNIDLFRKDKIIEKWRSLIEEITSD